MASKFIICILIIIFLIPGSRVLSQSDTDLPVYIVRSGDTINIIAIRFDVSPQDIIDTNQIENPDLLTIGTPLKIPGLDGVRGTLITETANLGASLSGISRKYQLDPEMLIKLNRLTSPSQIFVGSTIILPFNEDNPQLYPSTPIASGQSPLEYAFVTNTNPWVAAIINQKSAPSKMIPGENIFSPVDDQNISQFGSAYIKSISILPLPLKQGKTEIITVNTNGQVELSGSLNGYPLSFFATGEGEYVAIQGVHAMAQPGLATLAIQGRVSGEDYFSFEQAILLEPGYYPRDPVLYVDPTTLLPEFTQPEEDLIRTITSSPTPVKFWSSLFRHPVDEPICVRSWFGSRRSYNDGPFNYFHSGIDYGVCANLNIYAPAPGRVVYIGDLTVRGLSTIIDHGWGIFSGFWHQANTMVQVGDFVQTGQIIGEIGGTGRSTGPHLHWEIWANGVQVEPLDWITNPHP